MKFAAGIFVPVVLTALVVSGQTTAPSAGPTTAPAFVEREWVVLVCSPFQDQANQDGMVLSTLPGTAESRRQSAAVEQQNDPQPMGVIRLIGTAGAPVDVSLGVPRGKVMATWPGAKAKTNGVLWQNLNLSDALPATDSMAGQSRPEALDPGDWLNALRNGKSDWLRGDNMLERFLGYDVELDYKSPVQIEGGKDFKYQLTDRFPEGVLHLNLYKPADGGWRHAELAALGGPSGVAPATSTASPSTQPANKAELTLEKSPATQPADLLSPWKQQLVDQGILDSDADVIVQILEKNALDPKRLTAVYELDAAEMDRLLPLEILPEPTKTVRVGLVILKDADPGVIGEIDQLVMQLGDDDWAKRDAAYQALAKLGKAAKPALEKAQSSKDMEVVWRAERLLAAMTAQPAADQ